jgi:hypothetical protein
MNGHEIIGYLLAEQPFCAACIHDLFIPFDLIGSSDRSAEEILNVVADRRGIDRHNENSFSTYQFPKPLFATDRLDHETCTYCGRPLDGDNDLP